MAVQGNLEAVLDCLYWDFSVLSLIIDGKFERIKIVV
jgi:hypothetical protein